MRWLLSGKRQVGSRDNIPAPQMGPHAARTADAEPRTFPNATYGRTLYRWEGAWGREGEVVLPDARGTTVPQGVNCTPRGTCRCSPTAAWTLGGG